MDKAEGEDRHPGPSVKGQALERHLQIEWLIPLLPRTVPFSTCCPQMIINTVLFHYLFLFLVLFIELRGMHAHVDFQLGWWGSRYRGRGLGQLSQFFFPSCFFIHSTFPPKLSELSPTSFVEVPPTSTWTLLPQKPLLPPRAVWSSPLTRSQSNLYLTCHNKND